MPRQTISVSSQSASSSMHGQCVAEFLPLVEREWDVLLQRPLKQLTTLEVKALVQTAPLRHVAVIMDGNRRWAKTKKLPTLMGHHRGSQRLKEIIKYASSAGLEALTCYAFSTENWQRTEEEVSYLMSLMGDVLSKELEAIAALNVRILFLGCFEAVPTFLQEIFTQAIERTKGNTGLTLQLAINYGSHQELTLAVGQLIAQAKAGELDETTLTPAHIEACLVAQNKLPMVDLMIRPGGEQRLSNFLLWQSAYAELFFSETLWPDFSTLHFVDAVQTFCKRQRRFGK
ncbi:MAG: polyprenyl diphosphate synthase [Candidatus Melainabacteria bacterium]|nr:polyprenyl diphosphate synthase [Candidatus Melainabacteria bacterium]